MKVIADGLAFPEGPTIERDGSLYVTEPRGGRITKIARNGVKSVFVQTGGAGLAKGPDGNFYLCNGGAGRVEKIAPAGKLSHFIDTVDMVSLHAPNDLTFDQHGGFYFTDPHPLPENVRWADSPIADVCYSDLRGNSRRVCSGLPFPNGVAISPDGETLVVATRRDRAASLRTRLRSPGSLAGGGSTGSSATAGQTECASMTLDTCLFAATSAGRSTYSRLAVDRR